jgi:hypothetical protein
MTRNLKMLLNLKSALFNLLDYVNDHVLDEGIGLNLTYDNGIRVREHNPVAR